MEKKTKKKSIVIGLTSLLLVTLLLLGLTYAYYKTKIVGNSNEKSVSVTSKKYEVTYTDGDATLSTTGSIEPGFKFEKEFIVKNTGSESVNYSIILDNIENTFTRDQDWEYTLTKGDIEVATGTIAVGTHQVLIGSETLESGSQTYKLEVVYVNSDEDQSEDMGQKMSFRVNISDETQTWDTAKSGTLLYAIKNNDVLTTSGVVGSGETIPGQQASLETEARILSTQDDYGTSYVYRGNVTNNYVTYSNMCWRIVRVQGDGTIKLILADSLHACGTANGYSINDDDSAIPYKYSNSNYHPNVYNGNFNSDYRNNGLDLHGWMDQVSEQTLTECDNDNNCWPVTIREYHSIDKSKLVKTDFCNNRSGFGSVPSLKCNNNSRINDIIAILSADEVLLAGGTTNNNVTHNYYLQTNAKFSYFTMTGGGLVDPEYSDEYVYIVKSTGVLDKGYPDSATERPIIILSSNVILDENISGQNGTVDNPYVVG